MEKDILDLLPEEAREAAERSGYEFLSENGFNVDPSAPMTKEKLLHLKRRLRRRGMELTYTGMLDPEKKSILIWWELWRGTERLARSQGLKFVAASPSVK